MNTWQITLPQELADFVNEQLASKAWDSPEMFFASAVAGLQQSMALENSTDKDWLRAQIQIGIDEADRGELLDENEVFDEILADLRQPAQNCTT